MKWLVTLAEEGKEPYASGARALSAFAESEGYEFAAVADCRGERPWQAKRFALCKAFERGGDPVWWCDADVVIRSPHVLAGLLRFGEHQPGPAILVSCPISVVAYFAEQAKHNDLATMARVRARYQKERSIAPDHRPVCFWDYFVGYVGVGRDLGLRFIGELDAIAYALEQDEVTWTDAISIGLAAAHVGVPVRNVLPPAELLAALHHIGYLRSRNWYEGTGGCKP